MSELNVQESGIKGKSKTELITEISQLIDEIRFRAKRTANAKAYSRYMGTLIPLYGILLKAVSGETISNEDTEEITKAISHLIQKKPRRVYKIELPNGVVKHAD